MTENHELLRASALQLVADARELESTEVSGLTFIARAVILAAFALSGNDYTVFRETLPTLVNNGSECIEKVFPDADSARMIRRSILANIRPKTKTQSLPGTYVEFFERLIDNQYYFSDMPEQEYPIVTRGVV